MMALHEDFNTETVFIVAPGMPRALIVVTTDNNTAVRFNQCVGRQAFSAKEVAGVDRMRIQYELAHAVNDDHPWIVVFRTMLKWFKFNHRTAEKKPAQGRLTK